MIDHLSINIPFDASLVTVSDDGRYSFLDFDVFTLQDELKIASFEVYKDDDDAVKPQQLYIPYASLPSSYTNLAVKAHIDSTFFPYVQIKASPAKLLQGHNLFGTDNLELCVDELFGWFMTACPTLSGLLAFQSATISHIDITYSCKVKDNHTAKQVLEFMRNVSNGHTRISKQQFDTTVYWGGQTSRLLNFKCYLKYDEFIGQFEKIKSDAKRGDKSAMRVLDAMSDPRLLDWLVGVLRFEARLKKRYFERNGIPILVNDLISYQRNNPNFIQDLFKKSTGKLFDAIKGQNVKVTNDDGILKAIESSPVVLNNKGKVSPTRVRNLFALYVLIRDKGYDEVKLQFSKTSFYRQINDLTECGFSKAYLQNLHKENSSNVIPFVKLVEIDFNQQLPDWYVEPVGSFNVNRVA